MKHQQLSFRTGFRVAVGNRKSQGAVMVIAAGGTEGGPDNRHRGADQWLFVVEGTGSAIVNGHALPLRAGTLVLIEAGDTHEIRNTGRRLLKTINIYVPPAYDAEGDERPRGKN
jgi:mannose-6-phosphate isomerase-like protein (cupin superfamily)